MLILTRHADISAVLADHRFVVPPVAPAAEPGTVGWLRATVARFATGETHARRRALVTGLLNGLDPDAVRRAAFDDTTAAVPDPARQVPVRVLAAALGIPGSAVPAVAAAARAYHPGSEVDAAAHEAVARLVRLLGGVPDEPTANRIGVLMQAYEPTADLITGAAQHLDRREPLDTILIETLRHDPPVRLTRRVATGPAVVNGTAVAAGTRVQLDLAAANRDPGVFGDPERFDPGRPDRHAHLTFGGGPRVCPGRNLALALAAGVLEAL
jgi:cytochrome P450